MDVSIMSNNLVSVDRNGNLSASTYSDSDIKNLILRSNAMEAKLNVMEARLNKIQNMRMIRMARNLWHPNWQCKIVDAQNNNFSAEEWVVGIVSSTSFRNNITFEGLFAYTYIKDNFWHVGLAEYNRATNINMVVVMWAIPKSLFSGTLSITHDDMHSFGNYNWS
jgi:hypothetical protein